MKTAVVYYSWDGSTRAAAQALAEKLGADLFELKERKPRGRGFVLFAGGGFSAALGLKSRLQDSFGERMQGYGRILAGAPIWASSPAPALNAFLAALDPRGKQVMLFTVQADPDVQSPPQKGVEKRCEALRRRGAQVLPVLRLQGAAPGQTATKDAMAQQIDAKLQLP